MSACDRRMGWAGLAGLMSALLCACLPGDERPEPGELLIEAQRSDDARDGFATDDGWTLRFDRFVTALGGLGLGDEDFDAACTDYSLSFYDRLYDFAVADTSKFNLHYGLGDCTLRYRMGSPTDRTILMAGVTDADRELMGDPRADRIFGDDIEGVDDDEERGIGLVVEGSASKGGARKRFRWHIRQNHWITRCFDQAGNTFGVSLAGGDQLIRSAQIRPRELFRDIVTPEQPTRFNPYAEADVDGDGEITLTELEAVRLPAGPILDELLSDDFAGAIPGQVVAGEITLREMLEQVLFPRVASYQGVDACEFIITDLTIEGVNLPEDDD